MQAPSWVVVDVETTGQTYELNEILEIGAARVVWDGTQFLVEDQFHALIRPYYEIPHNIQNLTHIDPAMVENARRFEEVAPSFLEFLGKSYFVAHNVFFDLKMLNNSLERVKLPSIQNQVLDTQKMVSMAFPNLDSHRLYAIAVALGLNPQNSHRANEDAWVAAQVLIKCFEKIKSFPSELKSEIKKFKHSSSSVIFNLLHFLMGETYPADHSFWKAGVGGPIELNAFESHSRLSQPSVTLSDDLEAYLAPDGILQKNLKNFEYRHAQLEFLQWVITAFQESQKVLIEAGTGTGKTLAYLIPAIYYAVLKNKPVMIATRTKALQDQLISKDIPLLKTVLPFPINVLDMRGRMNYLCLRKMQQKHEQLVGSPSESEALDWISILSWVQSTVHGDLNELHSGIHKKYQAELGSTAETCIKEKCAFFHRCFALHRRRQAKKADLIITNHALLMSDLKSENNLLPEYEDVIIDEAHAFEESVTEAWSQSLGLQDLNDLLKDFISLPFPMEGQEDFRELSRQLFQKINEWLEGEKITEKSIKKRIMPLQYATQVWQEWLILQDSMKNKMNQWLQTLEEEEWPSPARLKLRQSLQFFEMFFNRDESWLRWIAQSTDRRMQIQMNVAPMEVSGLLDQNFWNKINTAVLCSATLQQHQSFEYIKSRLGKELQVASETVIPSPFQYEKQLMFCVPSDFPDWDNSDKAVYAMRDFLLKTLEHCSGKVLILFTSYDQMNRFYSKTRIEAEKRGFQVLCQMKHGSKRALVNRFSESQKVILLGTDSFWEGVDLKGLSMVLIQKLPFPVPSDLMHMARMEKMSERSENAFTDYYLPLAVTKLRQGIGRLIRSHQSYGVVILFDKRMYEKNYGSYFRDILPEGEKVLDIQERCLEQIKKWLNLEKESHPVQS